MTFGDYVDCGYGLYLPEWVAFEIERVAAQCAEACAPVPPPSPLPPAVFGETFVGWSQPPRPADVVVSFDPHASKKEQARSVLYDYYHDDPLRYWSDNEAVKRCFIGGSDPRKENHDPLLLIAAYENPKHKIWQCQGTGMSWREMNDAVQQAIAHRKKLGPLPKSSYDTNPVVIYYYDNDKMKRITYPGQSIPPALNASNFRWWAWGMGDSSDAGKAHGMDDVHTRETDEAKKIAVERAHPGWVTKEQKQALKGQYPWLSDMDSGSAGDWQSEGPQWDKDVAGTGVIGSITGAILALVSAVLDATGVGAVVGVPLGIATPFIVAAINATDTALHAGDFGAALANLGPALAQAAVSAASKGLGASGVNIPPAAMKALGGTVTAIANDVAAGQKKKLDFGQIWSAVAKKAGSYKTIGDAEAEAIAHVLGGPGGQNGAAGRVFVQGYLAGRFLDAKGLSGIAKILQAYATFADPRIINIALLGMGIGHIAGAQHGTIQHGPAARGDFTGQVIIPESPESARADLYSFVHHELAPRYDAGFSDELFVGFVCPEGYDPVIGTQGQLACAYHKKAACLGGHTTELGTFACTDWDYPSCPPGMMNLPGSPKNWCFPASQHVVGDASDYGPLSRGCPVGYWWDSLSGMCRPAEPLPLRHATGFDMDTEAAFDTSKQALQAFGQGLMHAPGAFQFGYQFGQRYL